MTSQRDDRRSPDSSPDRTDGSRQPAPAAGTGETEAWFAAAFQRADYRTPDATYEHYQPAYRFGSHARSQHGSREWDDTLDAELQADWNNRRDSSPLDWAHARPAVMEAYHAPTVGAATAATDRQDSSAEGGTYIPGDGGPGGDRFKVG